MTQKFRLENGGLINMDKKLAILQLLIQEIRNQFTRKT